MISEEQLAIWERLANEATDGPWCLVDTETLGGKMLALRAEKTKDDAHSGFGLCVSKSELPNYEFIAASREAVPELIAEVRRLNLIVDFVIKNSELCPPSRRNQDGCHVVEGYGWEVCPKCWREEFSKVQND